MHISLRLAASLVLFGYSVSTLIIPTRREPLCNGHPAFCERRYGNMTFLGSHDSFAYSENPLALARTQEVDITTQLELGVRMLQAQGRLHDNILHFCHTSCMLFNGGPVEDYLKTVKQFLDSHPNEVLTFVFTNPEELPIEEYWKPAFDKSGITPLLYIPPHAPMKRTDWPTLDEMIKLGKRIVTFIDLGSTEETGKPSINFILPEFQMVWEDPYSSTDSQFPCKIDRHDGPLQPLNQLNVINHNLNTKLIPLPFGKARGVLISDRARAEKTNSVESIIAHAHGCVKFAHGDAPNFVMLDYVNVGQGMDAVRLLNGL